MSYINGMNRPFEPSTNALSGSIVIQRLFSSSAHAPVVLLPPKGSNTRSPSSVSILIKNSAIFDDILAGCTSS